MHSAGERRTLARSAGGQDHSEEGRITVRRAGSRQHHVELGLQDPVGTRLSPAAPRGQQHAPSGAGWGLGCSRGCLQARISSNGDALCPRTVGVTKPFSPPPGTCG